MERREQCAQVGPRGGECRRRAVLALHGPLDFCTKHEESARSGNREWCRKCQVYALGGRSAPRPPQD